MIFFFFFLNVKHIDHSGKNFQHAEMVRCFQFSGMVGRFWGTVLSNEQSNLFSFYFSVTVHCSLDGSFQLVISRYATSPPLLLTSVVVDLGTCPPPIIIGDFLVVRGQLVSCSAPRVSGLFCTFFLKVV